MAGVYALEDVERGDFPSEVYLLVFPDGWTEIRETSRGERMVLGYSTYAGLAHACGEGQPWVRVSTTELAARARGDNVAYLAVDLPLPEGRRYSAPAVSEMSDLNEVPRAPESSSDVFIPSRPYNPAQRAATAELRADRSGRMMLLVFTSLAELYAKCGPHQPSISVNIDDMPLVVERTRAKGVLLNPLIAESAQHQTEVLDWTRRSK